MKKITLLSILLSIVFLSGCIGQEGDLVEFKDDIITIEDYYVDNIAPHEGSLFSINFLVKNNGDRREGVDVEVDFFDIEPFIVKELRCHEVWDEDETIFDETNNDYICRFNDIDSLDVRQVSITFQAPEDMEDREKSSPYVISYKINYDYDGYRKANIPLIDAVTVTRPTNEFSQSSSTYGPIKLDFEPPVGSSRKEGDKIIKEYWGVLGRPFEVRMVFEHVGSKSLGTISNINISKGNVMLRLDGSIERAEGYPCDFCRSGEEGCPTSAENGEEYLFSKEDVVIPYEDDELMCNFVASEITEPETTSIITARFDYRYEYIRTEKITVARLAD